MAAHLWWSAEGFSEWRGAQKRPLGQKKLVSTIDTWAAFLLTSGEIDTQVTLLKIFVNSIVPSFFVFFFFFFSNKLGHFPGEELILHCISLEI